MELLSSSFEHGGLIPKQHTCDAEDIHPALQFVGVPRDAKSLVLLLEDLDVPAEIREDGVWNHWLVFNIPPSISGLDRGEAVQGVQGVGTSGHRGYQGPCPPDGTHRYYFRLYALGVELDLPAGSTREKVAAAMSGHILDQAELMGSYGRPELSL